MSDKVSVFSHPRSGSHYVTALISTNFYGDDDYLKYYNGHQPYAGMALPASFAKDAKNRKHIYIYREFNGVSKSIFKLKNRFGLRIKSYDDFLTSTYKSMWSSGLNVDVKRETLTNEKNFDSVSSIFKGVDKTPEQYHKWHITQWTKRSKYPNIYLVSYDLLLSSFDDEMTKMAKFLGKDVKKFENIEKKIGWSVKS